MSDVSAGVCSHSTEISQQHYAIFSVHPGLYERTAAWMDNENISYKRVQGKYKHVLENSFVVQLPDVWKVKRAGFCFGQDCFLQLHAMNARGQRPASLVTFFNEKARSVGMFTEAPTGVNGGEDYTYDPSTGKTYHCVAYVNAAGRALSKLSKAQLEYKQRRERGLGVPVTA